MIMKPNEPATFEEWKEQYLKETFPTLKEMDPQITEEEALAIFIPVYDDDKFIGVTTPFDDIEDAWIV